MYINFINLCGNNAEEVMSGDSKRESCYILCEINSFWLRKEKSDVNGDEYWIISVGAQSGPDPKIHFQKEETALAFYNFLMADVTSDSDVVTIDVLEFGAV